jgi:hypothetical protein
LQLVPLEPLLAVDLPPHVPKPHIPTAQLPHSEHDFFGMCDGTPTAKDGSRRISCNNHIHLPAAG